MRLPGRIDPGSGSGPFTGQTGLGRGGAGGRVESRVVRGWERRAGLERRFAAPGRGCGRAESLAAVPACATSAWPAATTSGRDGHTSIAATSIPELSTDDLTTNLRLPNGGFASTNGSLTRRGSRDKRHVSRCAQLVARGRCWRP